VEQHYLLIYGLNILPTLQMSQQSQQIQGQQFVAIRQHGEHLQLVKKKIQNLVVKAEFHNGHL